MLPSGDILDASSPTVQSLSHKLSANVDSATVHVGRRGSFVEDMDSAATTTKLIKERT